MCFEHNNVINNIHFTNSERSGKVATANGYSLQFMTKTFTHMYECTHEHKHKCRIIQKGQVS